MGGRAKSGPRSIQREDRTYSKRFGIISKLRNLVKIYFTRQIFFVEIFVLIQLVVSVILEFYLLFPSRFSSTYFRKTDLV